MIARALVTDCQTLLLDEPCSALDLANQQVVLQLISDLAYRQGCSILFTTHDPQHALQIASHTLLLLPQGRWLAGPTQEIVTEDNLFGRTVYRCENLAWTRIRRRLSRRCLPFIVKCFKTGAAQTCLSVAREDKISQRFDVFRRLEHR